MRVDRSTSTFISALVVLTTCIAVALSFMVPAATTVQNEAYAHWRTAVAAVMAVTTIGSSILFRSGLKGFTDYLRRTYILLSIGIFVFGIAVLQLPIIALNDWWTSWYANSGFIVLPFVASTITMYVSMRTFSRLLKIPNRLTSRTFAHGIALTIGLASGVAAHFLMTYQLEGAEMYIAVTAWSTSYVTWAALLCIDISDAVGHHYRRAMHGLSVALIALSLSGTHEALRVFFVNDGVWYVDSGLYLIPFAISGFLLIRAGYLFSLLHASEEEDTIVLTDEDEKSSYINSVLWAASIVSRPGDIEPISDQIRMVTSNIDPDAKALTPFQKQELQKIYLTLEEYLVSEDPLKHYERNELRSQLMPGFRKALPQT